MNEREELQALRRLAELEARAKRQGMEHEQSFSQGGVPGFRTTLQFGPFDSGVDLPEGLSTGLAGAGKRMSDILTLGMREPQEADKELMGDWRAGMGSGLADMATFAYPGTKATQALAGVKSLASLSPWLRTMLAGTTVAGGIEGLTRPGGIGQRIENALEGGAANVAADVAMRGVGRIVGGPLRSAQITDDAKKLIEEGVPVPPWKATDSPRLRSFAERAKASVFGGPIIKDTEFRALKKWNEILVKNATPPQPVLDEAGNVLRWTKNPVTEVSDDTLNLLRDRFSESYDAMFKGRVIPIDKRFTNDVAKTLQATKKYYPSEAADVEGIAAKVGDLLSATESTTATSQLVSAQGVPFKQTLLGHEGATPGAVRQAIDATQDAINSAWRQGNAEKAEALEGLHDALIAMRERGLPPEVQSVGKDVNKAYQKFLQLQRAHSMMGAQKAGLVTPDQILSAQKALDRSPGKSGFARKNISGQRDAISAVRVLGSELPIVGPGTAEKLSQAAIMASPFALTGDLLTAGIAAGLTTKPGQNYIFGLLPRQAGMGNALSLWAPRVAQGSRGWLVDEY